MTEQMTPDEVLVLLDRMRDQASIGRIYISSISTGDLVKQIDDDRDAITAVAALIARNAELEAAMDICRKLAALRDGLDNSSSSAEEMASRLAHKAQALVARAEELETILGSLSAEADACVSLLRPAYDGHANFLAANVAKAIAILEKK